MIIFIPGSALYLSLFLINNFNLLYLGSALYLGAPLSSWTQTVLTDRLSRNIKQHDSVLQVVGEGNKTIKIIINTN